jgi:hypothetical protein
MKQKRIGKCDADDSYGVGNPKECAPVSGVETKQTNNRYEEIAGVPANHCQRQCKEQTL